MGRIQDFQQGSDDSPSRFRWTFCHSTHANLDFKTRETRSANSAFRKLILAHRHPNLRSISRTGKRLHSTQKPPPVSPDATGETQRRVPPGSGDNYSNSTQNN